MPVGWDSTLDEILDRGSLRIPIEFLGHPDTGDPPEMYRDPETGEPDGLAPRVGAMIAADLGVELEIVEILWPDEIPALFDRTVDLLPKHTLFPRRALQLEFAMGRLMQIHVTCQVPVERANEGLDPLTREGLRIGVWHGSSNRDVAERFFPAATVVDASDPTRLLLDGHVDAVVGDAVTGRYLELNPELGLLREPDGTLVILSRGYNKISIRPGDPRLLNWLNSWSDYRAAEGDIEDLCVTWWESFMADRE
ncbi:MAG: transporter substrate-binding domain-containing protein [Acidimicrobiia bacterium]|nr:transporter substrate-binding domain-containing protein [Acidimicrobiia bacterium]